MRTSFMIRRWWMLVLALASLRLAHINLLWADEDYHLSAAIQILNGRLPYRDFWYDKPPLAALFYLLIGGHSGWPLRVLDVLFISACCYFAYKLAKCLWGEHEGIAAALLLAFFTAFYLPSATIPFAVDGLLLLPHLAAVYFASNKHALLSGICCAVGLLTNVKAVFVMLTCALWLWQDLPLFALGTATPMVIALGAGGALKLLPDAYQQIWHWGTVYAANGTPISLALRRCADWTGFHAALLAGVLFARNEFRLRFTSWFLLSAASLFLGNHFAPRYFFQLLPVMVILAARGIVIGLERFPKPGAIVLALLLLIPFARFGPRYWDLIRDNLLNRQTNWADAALDIDSQQVANVINREKQPNDTLFVWGYRPDIYVYSRLISAGKFSDSQPLEGVPADRHLHASDPIAGIGAKSNRAILIRSSPSFLVDGLGALNPTLKPDQFSDLQSWLSNYHLIAETKLSKIYQRRRSFPRVMDRESGMPTQRSHVVEIY